MAVLGKIRSQGAILILVIALALFAFIIQGVLTSSGKSQDDAVGYVGDKQIYRDSFARQVENTNRNGGPNMTTVQAVNSVWDQNVRNAVLEEQIEAAGIEVTDEEVAARIKDFYGSQPNYQNEDGSFSEAKFSAFVNQLQTTNPTGWSDYIESVANSLKQERFFNLLKSGIIGTNAEGEMEYRMANDNRSFSYVYLPYSTIVDSTVEVSSGEIQKYINDHKDRFESEAQRDITFVVFKDEASDADKNEIKTKLNLRKSLDNSTYNVNTKKTEQIKSFANADDKQNYVNRFSDQPYNELYQVVDKLSPAVKSAGGSLEKGAVFGPYEDGEYMKLTLVEDRKTIMDSVQNRHILVSYAGAQRSTATRNNEEAKKLADSILAVMGGTKAGFDKQFDYFKENTEIAKGEDLGWTVYTKNAQNLAEGYRNFLYENDKGSIGIAESTFGYHIISIDDATSPLDQVKLATIANKVSSSKQTSKELFTKSVKFQQAAENWRFYGSCKRIQRYCDSRK